MTARAENANDANRNGILLEAGTNELEVLVFLLGDQPFGVNVAKVREIVEPPTLVAAPMCHASVLGAVELRGRIFTAIDLPFHLGKRDTLLADVGDPELPLADRGQMVIMEFNGSHTAFLVDRVEQIHRVSWSQIAAAPAILEHCGAGIGCITGVLLQDDRIIPMLDFESIADEILHERSLHVDAVENSLNVDRGSKRVVLAEDSPFIRERIRETFRRSGYAKAEIYSDGAAAWEAITSGRGAPIDAVVSDIEMPRMDGLCLARKIKETPSLSSIPIALFSSLVSDDNRNKGEQVGATVQIPKPNLEEMVMVVDRLVSGLPVSSPADAMQQTAA